jgi:NADH-quinone oxidoreductase subunit J
MDFLFYLLAAITLVSSFGVISVKQPIYAALWLIIVLVALAGIFALLSNLFLFTVQIILYAGAIMTLILFIIMFLNIREENTPKEPKRLGLIFGSSLLALPFILVSIKAILSLDSKPLPIISGFGNVESIGIALFGRWVLPFELISILLLVALLGAVTLGQRSKA